MRLTRSPLWFALGACVALCACAHKQDQEPRLVTVPVDRPISVKCIPDAPSAVDYPDSDQALLQAPNPASRYQLLYAGRKIRIARVEELENLVKGCE